MQTNHVCVKQRAEGQCKKWKVDEWHGRPTRKAVVTSRRCRSCDGAASCACRRRRSGVDGPGPLASSGATSVRWASPALAAALSLLLPRTGLAEPAGEPGPAAVKAAYASAARRGRGRAGLEAQDGTRTLSTLKLRQDQSGCSLTFTGG